MNVLARLKAHQADHNSLYAIFPALVLGTVALVLLTLTTFSLPFIGSLYFLRTSQAGGVRFGIWGWCLDVDDVCSGSLRLGYTWEPQIPIPITRALAFYPLSAILVLLTLITLVPILRERNTRTLKIFAIFTWCSFVFSCLGFVFMIAIWSVAKKRFEKAGWDASYGPLPWMSLVATSSLLAIILNSWRGTLSTSYLASSSSLSDTDPTSTTSSKPRRTQSTDPEKVACASPTTTPVIPPPMVDQPRPPPTNEDDEQEHPEDHPLEPITDKGDSFKPGPSSETTANPRTRRHPSHRRRRRSRSSSSRRT